MDRTRELSHLGLCSNTREESYTKLLRCKSYETSKSEDATMHECGDLRKRINRGRVVAGYIARENEYFKDGIDSGDFTGQRS